MDASFDDQKRQGGELKRCIYQSGNISSPITEEIINYDYYQATSWGMMQHLPKTCVPFLLSNAELQRQAAVTVYWSSKQLLLSGFVRQYYIVR